MTTEKRKLKYKNIGVISNPTKKDAHKGVEKVISILIKNGVTVWTEEETAVLLPENLRKKVKVIDRTCLPDKIEIMIVLGGDGTFLNVARLIDKKPVPLLGVNFGTLGFLTELSMDEIEKSIEKLLTGKFIVENRPVIRVKLTRKNGHIAIYRCVNEVVIKRDTLARIIEVELKANGKFVSVFRGDGLIVATPTGSTAYSLSAGGPIIMPTLSAMLITPICPHTLTMRPLVIDGNIVLTAQLKTTSETVMVIFDGQEGIELRKGDRLDIAKSPYDLLILRDPDKSYYQTLREKLNWG
ncbi:NAD(+)/NADH kinase [Desulfurobacterium atlanticum]|uniref:NAD kinase n=1 Tax=Desulfurobacterium atlanticum TaxID=240169 RepID=A0A238YXJ3_9BACT|nr:NAD(+)/NADH kinase [Desulfurobacterium atlanticum]SNR75219.1 NAD+ kinase [Desulfurobacterium atlanticum]